MFILEKLEMLAFEKRNCAVVFLKDGERITIHGVVNGIYDRDSGQVLKLQSGLEILLDSIVSVDGIPAKSFC